MHFVLLILLVIGGIIRGGSRTAATSKMEHFVIIVNGFQPLTIITKCSILDVAAVLDPPLIIPPMTSNISRTKCMHVHFWWLQGVGIKTAWSINLIGQLVKCICNQKKGCTEPFTCVKAEPLQIELYRCHVDCERNQRYDDVFIFLHKCSHLIHPENIRKPTGFLMFPGGIKNIWKKWVKA